MVYVRVCLFSKDRAWQAREAVGSFIRWLSCAHHHTSGGGGGGDCASDHAPPGAATIRCGDRSLHIDIVVLYAASTDAVAHQYAQVARAVSAAASWVSWQREVCLAAQLADILLPGDAHKHAAPHAFLFMVDDALWHAQAEHSACLVCAAHALTASSGAASRALCVQFKMHAGVWYSHPAARVCLPPRLYPAPCMHQPDGEWMQWEYAHEAADWGYAWDLCSGLYRATDVATALQHADAASALSHPNKLEVALNAGWARAVQSASTEGEAGGHARHRTRVIAPVRPQMCVVTVNRVQDVYTNRYHAVMHASIGAGAAGPVDAEGAAWQRDAACAAALADPVAWSASPRAQHTRFDAEWYARHDWACVHVGNARLLCDADAGAVDAESRVVESSPLVSVLLPVCNAEATIEHALRSVLAQTLTNWECLVIPNGCTDGSVAICERLAGEPTAGGRIVVLPSEVEGNLVRALNRGVHAARGEFIARMDADDVCVPQRLEEQVRFLRRNTHVDLVGAAVLTFSATAPAAGTGAAHEPEHSTVPDVAPELGLYESYAPAGTRLLRVCTYAWHPLALAWNAWFHCPLAHPAVCARRFVFSPRTPPSAHGAEVAPYDEAFTHAEDYELWLQRLAPRADAPSITFAANIARPLLLLRRSDTSISSRHAHAQRWASVSAVHAAVVRCLFARPQPAASPPPPSREVVACLSSAMDVQLTPTCCMTSADPAASAAVGEPPSAATVSLCACQLATACRLLGRLLQHWQLTRAEYVARARGLHTSHLLFDCCSPADEIVEALCVWVASDVIARANALVYLCTQQAGIARVLSAAMSLRPAHLVCAGRAPSVTPAAAPRAACSLSSVLLAWHDTLNAAVEAAGSHQACRALLAHDPVLSQLHRTVSAKLHPVST